MSHKTSNRKFKQGAKKSNMGKWDSQRTDILCQAILLLKDANELKLFLRDLLTEAELIEFANRFYSARMLASGVHYNAIVEDTGLSSRTIARVQHWRKQGMGGYRLVLSRLSKKQSVR